MYITSFSISILSIQKLVAIVAAAAIVATILVYFRVCVFFFKKLSFSLSLSLSSEICIYILFHNLINNWIINLLRWFYFRFFFFRNLYLILLSLSLFLSFLFIPSFRKSKLYYCKLWLLQKRAAFFIHHSDDSAFLSVFYVSKSAV